MANIKNKNDSNNKSQVKQIRPRESSFCEKYCKDVGECEKYKNYIERLKSGKRGYGIKCNKVINEF
jgi:hypothetical protein